MAPRPSYQFGSFRLDAGGRVLYHQGRRVALTPKAIDLLILLVRLRERPVGKDELLSTVWAGMVVEEGTLASHVSMLRKALAAGGKDAARDFIETLPKRGYRFVGPVLEDAPPVAGATRTFLFAAIEDGVDGAAPSQPAAQAEAVLQEVARRHGGQVLRATEEAACTAFADAAAAVRAAVEAQAALRDAGLRARMGLHSGALEATGHGGEPGGPTLARAACVVAAAQGGQVLATAATLALLDRAAPPGGEWQDLGDHTLRGFARPERLYQLSMAGWRTQFPPIRTPEALRTNLPLALTGFVGRQQALAQVRDLLHRARLVTLTGAGGIGKTRLALEAAGQLVDAFPDGVWLVELASLADAALLPRAIAQALGARGEGDAPPMALIEAHLRARRVLLVLDNCEHLIDEAARVAHALLRALPQLQLLVTSRQALNTAGEALYRVPSLSLPPSADLAESADLADPADHASPATPAHVRTSEAAQLFCERAAAVQPSFTLTDRNAAAVARVCRHLDGIPLAIELAAARLTALSVDELARRLGDRFSLLTGGLRTALPRQRTLRALVDWSYDLLPGAERSVLDALSVFAGSFTLEAAEQVAAADEAAGDAAVLDAIGQLVEKSLLVAEVQDGHGTRFRMLETIRQYAGEKLAQGGRADDVRRRHFAHFQHLATAGASALGGPLALEWLDRLEAAHDNLRAALDWSAQADHAGYARLAGALRNFWDTRGHNTEAWNRLGHALALHPARDQARVDALVGAGLAAYKLAHTQRGDELLGQAVALAQELGSSGSQAEALLWLACNRMHTQGPDGFEPLLQQGLPLARHAGDQRLEVLTLMELGRAALDRRQLARAQDLFLQSTTLGREAGCVIETPIAMQHAGLCALEQQQFDDARRLLDEALVQHRRTGNQHDAANTLALLARLALNERRLDEARALSVECQRVFRALHDPKCGAKTAIVHAAVLDAMGDAAAALPHAESAAQTYGELGFPLYRARALCRVGCLHATLGQHDAARRALFEGLAAQQRAERDDAGLPELLETIAAAHAGHGAAPQLLGAAAALRERQDIPLLPADRAELEARQARVRAQHAGAAFDEGFARGRRQSRQDAIDGALGLWPA